MNYVTGRIAFTDKGYSTMIIKICLKYRHTFSIKIMWKEQVTSNMHLLISDKNCFNVSPAMHLRMRILFSFLAGSTDNKTTYLQHPVVVDSCKRLNHYAVVIILGDEIYLSLLCHLMRSSTVGDSSGHRNTCMRMPHPFVPLTAETQDHSYLKSGRYYLDKSYSIFLVISLNNY